MPASDFIKEATLPIVLFWQCASFLFRAAASGDPPVVFERHDLVYSSYARAIDCDSEGWVSLVLMCFHRHVSPQSSGPGLGGSSKPIGGRFALGSVGRTCRSFLLAVVGFGSSGFCNLLRSHCGRYWAMVIWVS